jgi:hypothetical protein
MGVGRKKKRLEKKIMRTHREKKEFTGRGALSSVLTNKDRIQLPREQHLVKLLEPNNVTISISVN